MYNRVVIKIGTRVLSMEDGSVDESVIENITEQVAALKREGIEVILVTSGAVGFGRALLKPDNDKESIADKQVFSSVGQVSLMTTYTKLFKKFEYLCSQVLVTKEDFRDNWHYQNMNRCFNNLLRDGIIPIINENDVISIDELIFTDNDELAGLIAAQLNVDAVIILTNVDGVYKDSDFKGTDPIIHTINIDEIESIQKRITNIKTNSGRGGMSTKLSVARKLALSGIVTHIVNGRSVDVLKKIMQGDEIGTTVLQSKKVNSMKRRLAYSDGFAIGSITVNEKLSDKLIAKESAISLLPIGITSIEGNFKKGDIVEIRNMDGVRIGLGISTYNAEDISGVIGKSGGKAVIHYDYMFIE